MCQYYKIFKDMYLWVKWNILNTGGTFKLKLRKEVNISIESLEKLWIMKLLEKKIVFRESYRTVRRYIPLKTLNTYRYKIQQFNKVNKRFILLN